MKGFALGTAICQIPFLDVKVHLKVLLHQLQAVQMFLTPEDLPTQERRG